MKQLSGAGALGDEFATAQQHADLLAAPPPSWQAGHSRLSPKRLVGLAAAALAAGGALGWGWVQTSASPAPAPARTSAPVPSPAPMATPAPPPGPELQTAPPAAPAFAPSQGPVPAAVRRAAPETPASPLTVSRQGGVVRIDFDDAPVSDAARALAGTTHTIIRGGEALLATAGRLSLHWQGRSTVAAWDALLGRIANTAISCGPSTCELWIVGAHPAAGVAAGDRGTASPVSGEPAAPVPASMPPPASEDAETN